MPNSKEDLIIQVIADLTKYQKGLKKGSDETEKFEKNVTANLKKVSFAFGAAGVAVSAFVVASFNQFRTFETGLIGVQKTTNASAEELKKLGKEVIDLSEKIPVGTTTLLGIAEAAGQLGVKTQDIAEFTETVAKLGVTTDLEGNAAATTLARLLTITGESISDVAKLGSVLVELGNNFAASESEIAARAGEIAKATSQFDVSSTQAAALGAALAQLGVRTELSGSAIGRTFRAIDTAIREGTGNAFENLTKLTGIVGTDLKKAFETDSTEVFRKFVQGLNDVKTSGGSVTQELEIFKLKGEEINKVIPTLAANSELLKKALDQAATAAQNASALNDEAAIRFGSTASQLQLVQNRLNNLQIQLGEKVAPALTQAAIDLSDAALDADTSISILAATAKTLAGFAVGLVTSFDNLARSFVNIFSEAARLSSKAVSNLKLDAEDAQFLLKESLNKGVITEAEFNKKVIALKDGLRAARKRIESASAEEIEFIIKETTKTSLDRVAEREKKREEIAEQGRTKVLASELDRAAGLIGVIEQSSEKILQIKKDSDIVEIAQAQTTKQTLLEINGQAVIASVEAEAQKNAILDAERSNADASEISTRRKFLATIIKTDESASKQRELEQKDFLTTKEQIELASLQASEDSLLEHLETLQSEVEDFDEGQEGLERAFRENLEELQSTSHETILEGEQELAKSTLETQEENQEDRLDSQEKFYEESLENTENFVDDTNEALEDIKEPATTTETKDTSKSASKISDPSANITEQAIIAESVLDSLISEAEISGDTDEARRLKKLRRTTKDLLGSSEDLADIRSQIDEKESKIATLEDQDFADEDEKERRISSLSRDLALLEALESSAAKISKRDLKLFRSEVLVEADVSSGIEEFEEDIKTQTQTFATGGVVQGPPGTDKVPILATRGEMVGTPEQIFDGIQSAVIAGMGMSGGNQTIEIIFKGNAAKNFTLSADSQRKLGTLKPL